MRWKIIAVNSIIVLIVGLLSWALVRTALEDVAQNRTQLKADAERNVGAAATRLEYEALSAERWLAGMANDRSARDSFKAGTPAARAEGATQHADKVRGAALAAPQFSRAAPTLVAVVDASGMCVGRDGGALMRGADMLQQIPSLKDGIARGSTGSDVWADSKSSTLMAVSYAPVRDDGGQILGVLLMGTPLNDERLKATSDQTSGRHLILGIANGQSLELKAKTPGIDQGLLDTVGKPPLRDGALKTLQAGRPSQLDGAPPEVVVAAAPLVGFGDARRAVLVGVAPASLIENVAGLLWPMWAVTLLGLGLVAVGGFLLGNYISRPIEEIEEGLLAILNGKSDQRFEIEHAELGGLVFRLNSLLNQLMGVQEDDTDAEGRPSRPPNASDFAEALDVDEESITAAAADPKVVAALRAEPAEAYYRRIFGEYIQAKQSLGDPTGHITQDAFVARIRANEAELKQKHGKDVRYRVELRGREVVLIAVPLS